MNHDTLLLIFVACTTVAIVIQVVILFALYKAAGKSSARLESIATRLEQQATPVLTISRSILADAQPKISEITTNLAETTATIRTHATQAVEATGEIINRARMQAVRLDEMITSTANKVEETTDFLQHSVVSPVRRVHAIVQALNAGLGFLKQSRAQKKARPGTKEGEEEMFI